MNIKLGIEHPSSLPVDFHIAAKRIATVQRDDGAIPWYEDGPWDPWNHTECAMALAVLDNKKESKRAFKYLADTQKADGSWLAEYGNAVPMENERTISRNPAPMFHDTNFTAYCAVGIWHATILWNDPIFALKYWPMVKKAIDFVLQHQSEFGDISWSTEAALNPETDDALVAGNASIYHSLRCAIDLAAFLHIKTDSWETARDRLGDALQNKQHRFDRQKIDRSRFAMDWYYPILCGAMPVSDASIRLENDWDIYVEKELGCRCVADEPWVTTAETCELILTLIALEKFDRAELLFKQLVTFRHKTGTYWMGWQYAQQTYWPEEQPSWTQAAVILAADALYGWTASSQILLGHSRSITAVIPSDSQPLLSLGNSQT